MGCLSHRKADAEKVTDDGGRPYGPIRQTEVGNYSGSEATEGFVLSVVGRTPTRQPRVTWSVLAMTRPLGYGYDREDT